MAITKLNRGLIVSCQAIQGEPLYGCGIMHLFARAAKAGGACGIRALVDDIADIKREVSLPVIGLVKQCYDDSGIYITATKREVDRLLASECDVICMDATSRKRPNGETLRDIYGYARANCGGREIMADISTLEEAVAAEEMGFDYISTTLRGYTDYTAERLLPDIEFMAECKKTLKKAKLIAEGGIFEVSQIKRVSEIQPFAVVIGSAITRPKVITERFVSALKLGK